MTMIVTNINEVKAKLSEYLEAVAQGEKVVICKRNTPIAELRAITPARTEPRKVGGAAARLAVPESFFEPLPDDVLEEFEGRPRRPVSVGAEKRASYAHRPAPRPRSRGKS
jgi:antitoxin (DNA-binding transcriptional repressor) of toxin-antitoxin stability system